HRGQDIKASAYSPMRVILMRLGIAKVDEQSIPQELGDVPVIASNHLRTGGVIRTYHVPVLFRVELGGEFCGVHEVTEHHRELATFGFEYGRGDWCGPDLSRRDLRRGRQRYWRGGSRCTGYSTRPDEHSAVFIHRQLFRIDQVVFQGFEGVII